MAVRGGAGDTASDLDAHLGKGGCGAGHSEGKGKIKDPLPTASPHGTQKFSQYQVSFTEHACQTLPI